MTARRKSKRTPPILCQVPRCGRVHPPGHPSAGRRIPFQTRGGLSSHRRRAHGLAAIGTRDRRPKDGRYFCDVAGCKETRPYQTLGGLGVHKRKQHDVVSSSPAAIKKARQRARNRPPEPRPRRVLPPPPASNGFAPHAPDPRRPRNHRGGREYVRLQLLYQVNGTWAKAMNATPAEVRDAVRDICEANFAPPKEKTRRVPPAEAYG